MNWETIYKSEGYGSFGELGIEMRIGATMLPDMKQAKIRKATYEAVRLVEGEVKAQIKKESPATEGEVNGNKKLIGLFSNHIFSEEIPNGYCSDWCCRHLPWFVITTTKGRITIGWRKRVIQIDWSETVGTKGSEELFPNEDVTKGEKYIHAWGIEKAKEYIDTILN